MDNKKRAIALGNFDGIHKGHTAVIKAAVQAAKIATVEQHILFSVACSYGEFPKLKTGDNLITFTGGIATVRITPRWHII